MHNILLLMILAFTFAFNLSTGVNEDTSQSSKIKEFQHRNNPRDTLLEAGKRIYYASCNTCHKDSGASIAPGLTIMSTMTPRAILASLNSGKMRQEGANFLKSNGRQLYNG